MAKANVQHSQVIAMCFVNMYLYLYLSTFKGTCILLKYFSKNYAMYLYLYFNKCESTCTLLKYFHMYFAPCLALAPTKFVSVHRNLVFYNRNVSC